MILLRTSPAMPDKIHETDNRSSREKNEMSTLRQVVNGTWRAAILLSAAGTMLETSCSTDQVRAILAGVEVATSQLDQIQNDNITFGDWLDSALSKN